jgi:TolA-binding protein
MERDRQRSQALLPAERERAQRVFDQAFALWQAGDFDSAKLGFERGLGIDPANGNANYYLGDILTRRGLGGHLKTGQSWTGQNRPVGEPPPA